MNSYQQFFAELKRRKVFKVAAVYGVAAFVLLQVADLLGQGLRLGETFLPFITAIVLLGFPLALILAWAFEVTPEGVQRTGTAAAGEIEGIVAQPASSRWPAGLMALAGVAALVVGAWWVGRQTAPESTTQSASTDGPTASADVRLAFVDPAEDPRPSIAVLPFADMSPEGDQQYFSDGITEETINTLAGIREIKMAARRSAFAFRGRDLDMRVIGDSLDVDYLIEGSVRKAGDQLRITAQLIDATDGAQLWGESYNRELTAVNVFAIHMEIAQSIAEQLRVPLGLDDARDLVTPTADLEAYDLYLAGRARMRERGPSVLEAVELFAAAVAHDSTWAPAWAGLAESQALVPFYMGSPDDSVLWAADSSVWARQLDAAELAATTALALDRNNASATIALANVRRDRWDFEAAETAYLRALSLDPDNVEVHQQYAEHLSYQGRSGEALQASRRALALDRSPVRLNVAAYIARENGLYEEGVALLEEGLALDQDNRLGFMLPNLFISYLIADETERAWELVPDLIGPDRVHEARAIWPAPGPLPVDADYDAWPGLVRTRAILWQLVGDSERALSNLELVVELRPPFGSFNLLWLPMFEPLWGDPRFQALLDESGLAGRRPIRAPVGETP